MSPPHPKHPRACGEDTRSDTLRRDIKAPRGYGEDNATATPNTSGIETPRGYGEAGLV